MQTTTINKRMEFVFPSTQSTLIFKKPNSKMASPVNSRHFPAPPPPSSSDNSTTVIIVVFISFGCLFFVAFCLFALWCFVSKRRNRKKTVQETDLIHANEHRRIKEAIVEGPHGPHAVVLSVEDDKHFDEKIIKNEKLGKNMHAESSEIVASRDIESGESSSNSNQKA